MASLALFLGCFFQAQSAAAATIDGSIATHTGSQTSVSLHTPTGTKAGDYLFAVLSRNGSAGTINAPTGWTKYGNPVADSDSSATLYMYYKTASATDASGGSSYAWSWSTATYSSLGMWALGGTDLEAAGYAGNSGLDSASTLATSKLTTTCSNELLLAVTHVSASGTPIDVSPLIEDFSPSGADMVGGHVTQVNTGLSATYSSSDNPSGYPWQALLVGVCPAPRSAPVVYNGCAAPSTTYSAALNATPTTLNSVLGSAIAGDIIYLTSGNYGAVSISKKYSQFLTLKAAAGQTPIFSSLTVSDSSHLVIDGITVLGGGVRAVTPGGILVRVNSSDNIIFRNSTVESTSGTFPWKEQTVLTSLDPTVAPSDGINASQDYCIALTGNTIQNVFNGIYVGGDEVGTDGQNYLVYGNNINYFAGDGIDHSATNILMQGNHITNSLDICNLQCIHTDGIQGWNYDDKLGITNENVVIDSNFIQSQTGTSLSMASTDLHGISIFDGYWKNVTVSNNVILTSSITGISLAGVNGLHVVNNTVMNIPLNGVSQNQAYWMYSGITSITVGGVTHEGGTTSNAIVRNNIGSLVAPTAASSGNCPYTESYCPHTPDPGVEQDHNISLVQSSYTPQELFVTFNMATNQFNLHLMGTAPTNPAIGTGTSSLMPYFDITGAVRNPSSVDLGAYTIP